MPRALQRKPRWINCKAELPSAFDLECTFECEHFEAKDGDKPKLPKIKMNAYSGGAMDVLGFYYPVVVALEGVQFDKAITPIIADHDPTQRIGHTTKQDVSAKGIKIEGVASSSSQAAMDFVADSKNSFPFQSSIGARVLKGEEIAEGKTTRVNGRTVKGPVIVSRKTLIREVSVVVLGADSKTSTSVSAKDKLVNRSTNMEPELREFIVNAGFDADNLDDKQLGWLTAAFTASQNNPSPEGNTGDPSPGNQGGEPGGDIQAGRNAAAVLEANDDARREQLAGEEERIDNIRAMTTRYQGEGTTTLMLADGKMISLAAGKKRAIVEGWSSDTYELALMRAAYPAPDENRGPSIHIGDDAHEINAGALEVVLAQQMGCPMNATRKSDGFQYGLEHWYPKEVLEASHHRAYRSACLHQLLDMNIQAAGMHYSGSRKDTEYIKTALRANANLAASGQGFTTLTVSHILENVANKTLLAQYQAQEVVWPAITGVSSLSDFKQVSSYRLTVGGSYAMVGADGELKHGRFSDDKWTLQADTYGMIIALTRQDIINDDLGAFAQIPASIGRLAAIAVETAVMKMLLQSISAVGTDGFFNTTRGNALTGAGSALDIAGLTASTQLFADQVDDNGHPIMLSPDRLLTGTGLIVTARELFTETNVAINVGTTADSTEAGTKYLLQNPHAGLFSPYWSPFINNEAVKDMDGKPISGGLAGNQTNTGWWQFANPALLPAFRIGFLQGNRVPVIESAETSFETLGMQWRSFHDWGVGEGDPKAAVYNAGA